MDVIDYIEIATIGNALDFGNLTDSNSLGAASSPTRMVFSGGSSPGIIEYRITIAIASKGNAINLVSSSLEEFKRRTTTGASNSVDLIETDIDYFHSISSSLGNARNILVILELENQRFAASCASSPTRVKFAGGIMTSPSPAVNIIDYVTIASTGNAIDFGDVSILVAMG